jgi:DNA polymerase-1
MLFDKLGYRTTVYTDKTRDLPYHERKMSTGTIALTKLAAQVPVVKMILQWREQTKLLGTYLDKYENAYNYADDGRTHPSHLSAFVITGRFAVADPPYQQSPKKYHFDLAAARAAHEAGETPPPGTCFKFNFRDVIVAPPDHYILGFDLSQAELRAIAGEAQETALLRAFELGEDVHRLTASLMLGIPLDEVTDEQRSIGKTMNFALLYGMGVKSLADRLGIPVEEAQALMDKYFAGYASIATWSARQVEHGRRHGYVTSRFGRKLPIWEYTSDKDYIRQGGDRACVNYPIQGAATGDYMKIAMVRAQAAIKAAGLSDQIHLVMNIHDALEFYVHRSVDPQIAVGCSRTPWCSPCPAGRR